MINLPKGLRSVNGVLVYLAAILALFSIISCSPGDKTSDIPDDTVTLVENTDPVVTIKLATTTSLDNSGLLGHILPIFTGETGIEVDVIAVGTGAALEMGRKGDVDIVLVHAPSSEEEYIAEGVGTARHYIAQNEFVVVGPVSDPVGINGVTSAVEAFEMIMDAESKFISRGDNSGTHKRELGVWSDMGIEPGGEWYIEAGQGMGACLTMADEMEAYVLTDTGTYYSMVDDLDLVIHVSGDEALENIYSIIPLNPERYPDLKHEEAVKLAEWITGSTAAELINGFEVNGYILFTVKGS